MEKKSLFVVLEGLDGSGKTSVARYIAGVLNALGPARVKLTYEPHDPSCGGLFIRQVLMKQITDFSPKVLALAFAANRLDHCSREIDPWLNGGEGRLVLCDRYYLSSLVYQSSEDMDFDDVYALNDAATKPDLIFFLNVSNEVCYRRMQHRNQARELFETNLSQTREKFKMAMDFLRDEKDIKINEIDASGSIQEVAEAILAELYNISPSIAPQQSTKNPSFSSESRTILGDTLSYRTEDAIADLEVLELFKKADRPVGKTGSEDSSAGFISQKTILDQLETQIKAMSLDQLGGLFLGYIEERDYIVRGKLSGTELEAYEIEYTLPEGLLLRGVALIIPEEQRYDDILKLAPNIPKMSDFMFVFCPGPPELVTKHYERTPIKYKADSVQEGLFPSTKLISQKDLAKNMEHAARNISKTQLL